MRFRFVGLLAVGILLGLVIAVGVAFSATRAYGQETALPERVVGASPYPDNAVCRASDAFSDFDSIRDAPLRDNIVSISVRLFELCRTTPSDEAVRSGEELGWVTLVDHAIENLVLSLGDRLSRPVSAQDRVVLRELLLKTANLQRDFELTRIDAYKAVRTEIREVVRTVELPPVVVPPEPPPLPHDPCADALRQGACRWSKDLFDYTDHYQGSGDDWQLAKSSQPALYGLCNGHGDARSAVVGWLAQWREIRRHGSESFLGSGPMPRVAADMRAQLNMCGISVGGGR